MTTYDDPNREAVGQPPIWTGADAAPAPDVYDPGAGFDPGAATVADVQAYVEANPDQRDTVADAESAGKGRVTLLEWLDAFEA